MVARGSSTETLKTKETKGTRAVGQHLANKSYNLPIFPGTKPNSQTPRSSLIQVATVPRLVN
jgi:hypothetical protein